PRASVAESADDLKARDAVLRRFPEVEQVVGKAGRADTPTDPAPLDMVETVVDLRPHQHWPRRHLREADARAQTGRVLARMQAAGLVRAGAHRWLDAAGMAAIARFDAAARELAL